MKSGVRSRSDPERDVVQLLPELIEPLIAPNWQVFEDRHQLCPRRTTGRIENLISTRPGVSEYSPNRFCYLESGDPTADVHLCSDFNSSLT